MERVYSFTFGSSAISGVKLIPLYVPKFLYVLTEYFKTTVNP